MMHLGPRVAALVDGQLSPADEERAWSHVHGCPTCRAAVEREGWVKRQLACLSFTDAGAAPDTLKGSLSSRATFSPYFDEPVETRADARGGPAVDRTDRARRIGGLAALGAGSVGAAMFGVIAFSAAPAQAPVIDRCPPTLSIFNTPTPTRTPTGGATATTVSDRDPTDTVRLVATAWTRMGL